MVDGSQFMRIRLEHTRANLVHLLARQEQLSFKHAAGVLARLRMYSADCVASLEELPDGAAPVAVGDSKWLERLRALASCLLLPPVREPTPSSPWLKFLRTDVGRQWNAQPFQFLAQHLDLLLRPMAPKARTLFADVLR